MPRIPYFDPANAEGPRAKKVFERSGPNPLNLFRMLGHAGEMIDGWTKLGNQILNYAKLDPVLREIVILRVGVLKRSDYEVFQHRRVAKRVGMSPELIEGVIAGADAAVLDDLQRKVVRFVDEAVELGRPTDATFDPLAEALSSQELNELVITIGYYLMVCVYLKTLDIEIESAPRA
jgi:alkylhydroperoxidase family enzyme